MANKGHDGSHLGVLPDAPGATSSRIGQACLACRRKKVKCDGQVPCHNCSSRDFTCEYPRSNDNASASRHYAKAFEDRFQQLDGFCQRLETLSSELSDSIAAINQIRDTTRPLDNPFGNDDELQRAAHALQSLPVHHDGMGMSMRDNAVASSIGERLDLSSRQDGSNDFQEKGITNPINDTGLDGTAEGSDSDSDGNTGPDDDEFEFSDQQHEANDSSSKFGSLVTDSYGRLRYLGGATNSVLVEAIKGLSPGCQSSIVESSPGSASAGNATANIYPNTAASLQIPLFVQGQRWPEMPYLPQPEEITRPPQYVADLLVNLYFDQLHYTFPVLYQPHFMACYKQMSSSRSNTVDRKFLSVFFAVCACASSLLPSDGRSTSFPGLEHYQKSLILHYASTGEASIERVQCLALLAMCSGGWNTLTQSWTFAGQAVRAAQDLGMHLSSLTAVSDHPGKLVKQQLFRRIWWSVYCLDRVTSICLGRPMAADDMDCHCEIPLSMPDEELEAYSQNSSSSEPPNQSTSSPMTGFLAFTQLCRIGGRIQRLHSPSRIRELADPKKVKRFFRSVTSLQKSLDGWLASLPDEIRFSANVAERGPNLTMCVIMFIVHAGSLLNLYRSMSGPASQARLGSYSNEATSHCVSAARSCINAAELVRELVAPSHHLAFCVHYLTLSGLVLLRMPEHPREQALPDVDKCVRFLKGLEMTWSGASKGRAIIEHLLKAANQVGNGQIAEYMDEHSFSWAQLPGSELFGYEGFSSEFLNL